MLSAVLVGRICMYFHKTCLKVSNFREYYTFQIFKPDITIASNLILSYMLNEKVDIKCRYEGLQVLLPT